MDKNTQQKERPMSLQLQGTQFNPLTYTNGYNTFCIPSTPGFESYTPNQYQVMTPAFPTTPNFFNPGSYNTFNLVDSSSPTVPNEQKAMYSLNTPTTEFSTYNMYASNDPFQSSNVELPPHTNQIYYNAFDYPQAPTFNISYQQNIMQTHRTDAKLNNTNPPQSSFIPQEQLKMSPSNIFKPHTSFCSSFELKPDPKVLEGRINRKRTKESKRCLRNMTKARFGQPKYQTVGKIIPRKRRTIIPHNAKCVLECQYCGQEFTRKNSLKRHEALHTGEKNFHCKGCNKAFARQDILKRHRVSKRCQKSTEDSEISSTL